MLPAPSGRIEHGDPPVPPGHAFYQDFAASNNYFTTKLDQRPQRKHLYTSYCRFLYETVVKIRRSDAGSSRGSSRVIAAIKSRMLEILGRALRVFKADEDVWTIFISFLIEFDYTEFLNKILDSAIYWYGHKLDKLFYYLLVRDKNLFAIADIGGIEELRGIYLKGLWTHQDSELLYIEAFKLELNAAFKSLKNMSRSVNDVDLNKDLFHPFNLFQLAKKNVHRHSTIFYQMFEYSTWFHCASKLGEQILRFLKSELNTDPNYWDDLAKNELINDAHSKGARLRQCIEKYKEAVLVVGTIEMWNKYIEFVFKQSLNFNLEPDHIESDKFLVLKRVLLRYCILYIHDKKKYEPQHYIRWINMFKSSMAIQIIQCAVKRYPNNINILELSLNKLMKIDKLTAMEFFKENAKSYNVLMWIYMVDCLSNEPYLKDILNMVFEDDSIYSDEVRPILASKYIEWVYQNKSLHAARNAYYKLIKNSNCNKKLYIVMVNIEMEQPIINMMMIKKHLILACMQFGDIDFGEWARQAYFELEYCKKKTYLFVCNWVATILEQGNVTLFNYFMSRMKT